MTNYLLKLKSAILTKVESKYFALFCIFLTFFLIFLKRIVLDLCIYGIFSAKACSVHRIPKYEGYYSFNIIYAYVIVFIFFTLFFLGNYLIRKKIENPIPSVRIVTMFFLIPVISFFLGWLVEHYSYRPIWNQITQTAVIDCCEGSLTFSWGEFANLDKESLFCLNKWKKIQEKKCRFQLKDYNR